jgi:hypothetical protein
MMENSEHFREYERRIYLPELPNEELNMSTPSGVYLRGIPTKPYDLLKELLIISGFVLVMIVVLSVVMGSPDYPTVRGEDVAKLQPVTYLTTCTDILSGNASIQDYGPPYNSDTTNSQRIGFFAPEDWSGVTIPVNPRQDFILKPLERVGVINGDVASALQAYNSATEDQQNTWVSNFQSALDKATLVNGKVQMSDGDYGPVPTMMSAMLALGQAGLLEGALESNDRLPYTTDYTNSLLFFQDDVYASVADQLDLTGSQWGIVHETGNYPGAWWLWPYAIFYHIPPMSSSPNGDIQVGVIMIALFLILLLLPFVPGLNRLPRWLGVYKLIWRDWYADKQNKKSKPAK